MVKREAVAGSSASTGVQKKLKFGSPPSSSSSSSSSNELEHDDSHDELFTRREQQEKADGEFALQLLKSEGTSLASQESRFKAGGSMIKSKKNSSRLDRSSTSNLKRANEVEKHRERTVSSNTETISLIDSDDDDDNDDDDDDMIVTGFTPSTPKSTPKIKASSSPTKSDKGKANASAPAAPIASFFQPRSTATTTKTPTTDTKPSLDDTKPRIGGSTSTHGFFSANASSPSKPILGNNASTSTHSGILLPLDISIYSFNPSDHVDTSAWPSKRMPYSYLTSAFVLISSTKSRLFISRVLTNLFRVSIELDPTSLESLVYLCSNRIGPAHERDLELGVGPMVLSKAFKEVSGLTSQALRQLNKLGDPGDVAYEMKKSVRLLIPPPPLVVHSLFSTLTTIAKLKGSGSLERKTSIVKKLLVSAQGEEARYLIRTLVGNLRIGAVRLTIITALAKAFCLSRIDGTAPRKQDDEFYIHQDERDQVVGEIDSKSGTSKSKEKIKGPFERLLDSRLDKAEAIVRKVWARHPDYGHVVSALLKHGIKNLEQAVPLQVGTPLEPMLGSITRGLKDIYERLGDRPFVSEAKLDGQRGQIHVSIEEPKGLGENSRGKWYDPPSDQTKDQTRIWIRCFSRHLEDMSDKYPDIAPTLSSLVQRESNNGKPLTDFILDCEIVAIDPVTSEFKTFQELSYRSKKDVQMGDIKVRVGIFGFDLMYMNGESLLSKPFRQRRELLYERFSPLRPTDPRYAKWELVPSCLDNEIEKVSEFFQEALKLRAEGIMVKLLDEAVVEEDADGETEIRELKDEEEEDELRDSDSSTPPPNLSPSKISTSPSKTGKGRRRKLLPATYEPDKRADSWLKVKKDYLEDLGDSLDLIPIGAWHGNGRKAAWWSPILLGVYDSESGQIQAVCKCMSGFTDEFYKGLNVKYSVDGDWTSRVKPSEIEAAGLRPSIWFKPNEVWEMRGADFTLSPVYPAAQHLLGERGVSIRFPRFIKVREDKTIEQATSTEQLASMYENQGNHGGGAKAGGGDEVEMVEEEEG